MPDTIPILSLPVLSLVVAILAVIVGPFISLKIAKRQISSSLKAANKQIVAPMRQAWINSLRDLIAEMLSSTIHYYQAGFEEREEEEYRRLTDIEQKISLMLNFKEDDHKKLYDLICKMHSSLALGKEGEDEFFDARSNISELSRTILKREWDRVKEDIPEA